MSKHGSLSWPCCGPALWTLFFHLFSPVPPDRWYFVLSHFDIIMLFSLFYRLNLFDQFFLTNKIDTENSSSCNQNLLNWSLRLRGVPLSDLKMVKLYG